MELLCTNVLMGVLPMGVSPMGISLLSVVIRCCSLIGVGGDVICTSESVSPKDRRRIAESHGISINLATYSIIG